MKLGRVLAVTAAVLLIVVVAFWLLYSSLDSIVQNGIEKYGSQITGTRVQVSSVHISVSDGRGTLRGVRIGNPEGFSDKDAISFGAITLAIDVATLAASPVVVQQVLIDTPQISYELNSAGQSNIDRLKKHVENYQSAAAGRSRPGEEQPDQEAPRLAIRQFRCENGKIEVDAAALGREPMSAELPTVQLTGLGGSSGVPPDQIGQSILRAFAAAITRAVAQQGIRGWVEEKIGGRSNDAAKKLLGRF